MRASNRVEAACADLCVDPRYRLSEQVRALLLGLLESLVEEAAEQLTFAAPSSGSSERAHLAGSQILRDSGLVDDRELVGIALRRTDEERLQGMAAARSSRREARLLQSLISHDDGAVAAAAMAVVLGRGRRRDRLGRNLTLLDDLPAALARRVINRVAAVLAASSPADAPAYAQAVDAVLDRHDEARGLPALMAALVEALDEASRLDGTLVIGAASEGELAFLVEVLARRADAPSERVADALLSGDSDEVAALLKVANCERTLAAGMLAAAGDLLSLDDAADAIVAFDRLDDPAELERARAWLRADPDFAATLDQLGGGRGQHRD